MFFYINTFSQLYNILKNYQNLKNTNKRKTFNYKFNENRFFIDKYLGEKPLNSCLVLSSHNSYLSNHQNFDMVSLDILTYILKIGCRFIELDIYYKNNQLLVGHGTKNIFNGWDIYTTNLVPLEEFFKIIRELGFNCNAPLFINLELLTYFNPQAHQEIKELIDKYFSNFRLGPGFAGGNKFLGGVRLKKYRNKVIFLTGTDLLKTDVLFQVFNGFLYKKKEILSKIDVGVGVGVGVSVGVGEKIDKKWIFNLSNKEILDNKIQEIVRKHIADGGLVRVFPCGGIFTHFSNNFDFQLCLKLGVQFIAFNLQNLNKDTLNYMSLFDKKIILEK